MDDTVFLYEEEEYTDDIRVFYVSGLLTGSCQGSGVLEYAPEHMTPEEAIAWGRERSPRVVVQVRGGQHYSAGVERVGGFEDVPEWPAEGVPLPAEWVTLPRMEWLDRTEEDGPISWDVELSAGSAFLSQESLAAIDNLAAIDTAIADALCNDESIGIVDRWSGIWDRDSYLSTVLLVRLDARTEREAWDMARTRIRHIVDEVFQSAGNGPSLWQISIWAVPTDADPPRYPRRRTILSVVRD